MQALLAIVSKPDNLPILAMFPAFFVLGLFWWREARHNDRLLGEGGVEAVQQSMRGELPDETLRKTRADRLHTWPYLVRVELLGALVVMLVLVAWSLLVDAPLEQMANPRVTPNPSKAPWYFVGLQEMLVYFDPWIAGVTLPILIVGGLAIIPYVDVNPDGSGFHSWRRRRFAIGAYLFGFAGLWLPLIAIGMFCRGPGWQWFWPWVPWSDRVLELSETVNWPELFGITDPGWGSVFGGLTMCAYYGLAVGFWAWKRHTDTLQKLGAARYAVVAFLLLTMMGLPLKMFLRLAFSVKYVWTTPWFNI